MRFSGYQQIRSLMEWSKIATVGSISDWQGWIEKKLNPLHDPCPILTRRNPLSELGYLDKLSNRLGGRSLTVKYIPVNWIPRSR
jgi:hypothetical protein